MLEIIPGILEKDWNSIERKIEAVKHFAKVIHIDIIDGKFEEDITFLDPTPFAKYSNPSAGSGLFFELHMMVNDPIQYLEPFANVGFKRFLGHVESLRQLADQEEFVAKGQMLGEVGLAIDGPTDLSLIKVPYSDLDSILVMTIKAGKSGQEFNEEYLKKIEILKHLGHDIKIEVDGGINDQTIGMAKNAGATRFVSTSFIFNISEGGLGKEEDKFNILKNWI